MMGRGGEIRRCCARFNSAEVGTGPPRQIYSIRNLQLLGTSSVELHLTTVFIDHNEYHHVHKIFISTLENKGGAGGAQISTIILNATCNKTFPIRVCDPIIG